MYETLSRRLQQIGFGAKIAPGDCRSRTTWRFHSDRSSIINANMAGRAVRSTPARTTSFHEPCWAWTLQLSRPALCLRDSHRFSQQRGFGAKWCNSSCEEIDYDPRRARCHRFCQSWQALFVIQLGKRQAACGGMFR